MDPQSRRKVTRTLTLDDDIKRARRHNPCPTPESYSSGSSYSVATSLVGQETTTLKEGNNNDDGESLNGQQDGPWGKSSRHVTIREEEEIGQSHVDLESIRVVSPIEECAHCVNGAGGVETPSAYAPSSISAETSISLDLPTIMSDQNEFALYPRFGRLNCLNLLHLQQHLFDLEQQLADLDLEELALLNNEQNGFIDDMGDMNDGPEDMGLAPDATVSPEDAGGPGPRHRQPSRVSRASRASILSLKSVTYGGSSAQEKADREDEGCRSQGHILRLPRALEGRIKDLPISLKRCKLMGEIEMTLGAYNRALLSYSQLINLPTAHTRDRQALKNWLQRADDPLAKKSDTLRFLDEDSADVIALCARDADMLETFFQSRLLRILEEWPVWAYVFPSIRGKVATIRPTIQSRATLEVLRFLISLGGAVLIVAPVLVLYFTRSEWGRLMIICVCTLLFAILMHMFTASDKKEVLMATTGYAAVLVVFVGSEAFSDHTAAMPGKG